MQYVVMRETLRHRETRKARERVLRRYPGIKRLSLNDRQWYIVSGPYYSNPKEKMGVYAEHVVTGIRAFLAMDDVAVVK